jgi:hypothetical protein
MPPRKKDAEAEPEFVIFTSREPEPFPFALDAYWPQRSESDGRLFWSVPASEADRVSGHFFVETSRIVRS